MKGGLPACHVTDQSILFWTRFTQIGPNIGRARRRSAARQEGGGDNYTPNTNVCIYEKKGEGKGPKDLTQVSDKKGVQKKEQFRGRDSDECSREI